MGAWGTAIPSNDTFADVHDEFFNLYNDGHDVAAISEKLIAENQETITDPDEGNNFWFALAKAQWECKMLSPELLSRVKQLIESGADLEVWRQLDATSQDLKKRKAFLDKFLAEIQTEKPKAKPRKKKIIRQPVFEKGDCLTFKLANSNYGGAVVLEEIRDVEYGLNLIAVTRINQPNKPTRLDFVNAEVLVLNHHAWADHPEITWFLPIRFKAEKHLVEKVDTLTVEVVYAEDYTRFFTTAGFERSIIESVNAQFKSEETKPAPVVMQRIADLVKA